MSVYKTIRHLIQYAVEQHLMSPSDSDYAYNKLLDLLALESVSVPADPITIPSEPSDLLTPLLDHAVTAGLIPVDTIKQRDIFEAKLMDIVMPRPSEWIQLVASQPTPQLQTELFYHLSQASNYIKTARTSKNIVWKGDTDYGTMDITINLSKPEKDPKDIILQGKTTNNDNYPACLLCKENVGYNGAQTGVGRTNHRIIPVTLNDELFHFQYSPYVYYNEHCIILQDEHVPMNVTKATFVRLFDFLDQYPHYFLGSNAGLPIVGGSILSHEHYQGGRYHFAIEEASVLDSFVKEDVTFELLHWPLSVIRLRSTNRDQLIDMAHRLYQYWVSYDNPTLGIHSYSGTVPHNAITPIARMKQEAYELDMTLRNNLTSDAFPLGVFHPHPEHHHIKKENIGLIEVMGLAVLPARLKDELATIQMVLATDNDIPSSIAHHTHWMEELKSKGVQDELDAFLRQEVAIKFTQVLEDAGVFKQNEAGIAAFQEFLMEVKQHV